ncbi:phosphoglycerate mutase family protein [Toxoplasma gondii]|uniref:Phosphoglycerate mutase family protein n=1 Tax=Toxoplasma gondii TaxID=5811 RepID=A0A7J6K1P4_TOXGO|nr:phosphoglycerate mutase family protein [Toxoplasma gondii]
MATEDCPSNTLQHETSVTERSPPLSHDALNGRPHFVEHNCSNIERRLEWFSRTLPTSASIECRDLWKQAAKAEQSFPVDATVAPLNVIKPQRRTNVQGAGIRTCSESSITGAASAQTTSELPSRAQKNLRRRNRLKPSADGSNFDTQRYSCVPMQVEYTHHPRVPLRTPATAVANSRDHEAGPVNAESHARMRGHPRTGSMQMNSVLQTQRRGENIDRSVVFRTTSNTPLCPSLCSDAAQEHQRCWRTGGSTPIHWVPWPSPDCQLCQNEGAGATEMWKSILRRNQGSDRLPGHPNGHIDSNGGSSEAGFRLSAVEAFEPRTRKPLLSVAQSSHPQCDTAKHAAPGPLAPGRLHCFVQGPVSQRYQSDSIHGRRQQQRVDTMMSHANIEHPYQASERMSMSGTGKRPYPEPGSAYLHSSTKSKDSNQGLSLCKYPGSSGLQHHLHVVQLLESETRRTTEAAHASAGEGLAGKKKAEQKQHRTFILRSVLRRARALKPKATHLKVFLVNCGATTTVSRVQGGAVTGWSDPARRVAEMSERIAAPCTYSSELTTRGLPDDYESEDPLTFEDLGSSRNDMLRQWKDANLSLGECHRRRVSDLSFPAAFSVSPNHPCVVGEADGQRSGNEFSWVDHGSLENPNTLSFSSCPTEDQEGLVEVLSKEGQKQAIAAAKLLRPMRFTMIYCSDDAACQEMKNVILTVNRESPYVDDKRLGNRRKGDLAHLSNAEFMRRATKAGFTKETFRPPGGESLEDVRERVVRFFLEALVGEFLLSLNLRDFIAKAAMDQRRAITRTNCFTLTDVGSYCELLKVPPSVQTSILTSSKLLDVNGEDALLDHSVGSFTGELLSFPKAHAGGNPGMGHLSIQDQVRVEQEKLHALVGTHLPLHKSKGCEQDPCEVTNVVDESCCRLSIGQSCTRGVAAMCTTTRCDAANVVAQGSCPAWKDVCHSPPEPFTTQSVINGASASPKMGALQQPSDGSQAPDFSAEDSVGSVRAEGGHRLSCDLSSVNDALHVVMHVPSPRLGKQAASISPFVQSDLGVCRSGTGNRFGIPVETRSAHLGSENAVYSGTGKRQRRRRRRRKRAHLTASLDAEEGNEDTCLCPRKISKGVADSSGLLMNSHDASAVCAERVTGNNVCLDERGYDGVVGQDEQEEFEFASVASCASVLYQSGLATDDEYASGGSAINTKINELPHEVEANDNGQGKTHPDEPDAEGNTTLRSEAFSSKIVEEILEDGQTATRCWTPLREAQEKSEETRNLGLIHLSATTAVQPLEITTEETGKYETTADVGKCSWMLAAPERRRGADEACYEALKSEAVAEPSLNGFRHSRVICHASGAEPDSSSSAKATKECVSLSLSTNSANTVSNMQCIERSVVLPCVREEDCVSSSQGFSSLKSGHVLVASTLSDQQRIMFTRFLFFEEGQKILGSRCMLPEMGACQGNAGSSGMQFDNPAGDASPGERPQAGEHDVSVFTDLREVPERTLEKPVQDEIGSRRAAQMDSSPPVAGEFFDPECPIEPDGTSVNRESIEVSGKIPKTNTHLQREQVTSSSSEGFSRELENRSGDNDNGRLPVDDVKHKVIEAHATADEQSDYRKIVDRSKSGEKLMVGSFPQIVYDGEVTEDSGSRPGCCLEEFLHDVLVEYDSDVPPVRQRKEQTRPSGAAGDGGRCERMEQQGGLSLRDSHSLSQCSRRLQAESDCVAVSFPPSGCALLPSSTTSVDDVNELTAERGSCHSPYQNCQTMPISSPRRGKKLSEVNSGSLLPTWIAGGVCEGKTSCVSSSPVNNETCVARPDPGANDFTNWLSAKERTDHIYPVTDYCRDGPASGQDAAEMCVKQFSETCQRRPFPASVKDRGDACGACQLPPELQTPFVLGDLVTSEPEAPSEPSMPHKCFDGYSIFSPALGRTRSTLLHVDGVDAMGGDASFYFRHASESCRDTRWTKPARGRIEQNHHSDCEEHYSSRIPLSRWRQPCGAKVVLPLIRNRFLLRPAHSAPSLRTCDKAIPWLQPPVASVKPREEPESQPKWHTTRLLRSRSLLDSKYSDRGTPRIPEVRASTSAVAECVCEREALTNHDRKERFKVHNPKQDEDAVSGTEPVVVQRRPPSTVRLSAYGAMPAAEGRKPRGAARRCRAALITNEARQHFDSMRQRQNSLNVTSESATREKNISCCSALKTQSGHNLRKDTARFVTDLVHSFAAALTECASAGFSPPSASLAHDCSSTGCGTNSNDSSSNIEESDGIGGTGSDGFSGTGSDSGWASTTYRGTAQTAKRSLSSLSRTERTCVGNTARHNDADVGFRTEQAKLCEGRHMGNACGGGAGACGRSTALEEPEDSMAVRGLNLRHWSGSWLGSLLARIGPSSRYNNTGAAESCGSSGTELVSLETEHEVRSPSEDADAHCKKAKEAVVKGMSGTGGARDNVWNDGHTRVSLRGYRVLLLMKRTVAQCVAASVASGLWLPSVSSLEAGFTKACPQTDQASTTGNSSVEDRDGDTTKSGCLAVLVITRECVIRELLQALCGRRFGNTIKAGSITVLDVYTRRTGNTELQRSLGRRRSEAWTWLTGRGSSVHQYLNDGRVQSIGAVGKGRGPHASTCCSLNRSLSDSYDASTASVQAEQRHVGGPEGFPCEWGNGEETSHTGTQAQEFDKSDGLKFDAKTTEGTVAESSSSLSRDEFSKCGHTESEAGTRVQACNGVPSSRRQVDCGESEARCSEDFMAVPRFSWECEHCSVNDDENVQKGGFKSDAPRRSQLHEDGIRHGKIGRSRTMSGTIGSQCSMKKTVGRRVYGSSLCGTCSAEHSLRGIEKSPRKVSEIDDEEVSVDLSDLKLLAAPYKSTRPFASEQRVEAVDALLSRVQCWVEVFNKKE